MTEDYPTCYEEEFERMAEPRGLAATSRGGSHAAAEGYP